LKHFREVIAARTPEEAARLRKEAGAKGLYIAGGTMVVPLAAEAVEVLVDIGRLDLVGATVKDGRVTIGALTRLADLLAPEARQGLPLVYDALRRCATPIIRNAATVGGCLAVAHLPSDLAVALLAMDANLEMVKDEPYTVSIKELLARGWLKGHDLICRVEVEGRRYGRGYGFSKFGRSAIDIGLVNAAVVLDLSDDGEIEHLRVAVGQSNSLPAVFKDVAAGVKGKQLTSALIKEISKWAADSIKPKPDFRASADYRKHLVEVMVARALAQAAHEAGRQFDN
jgi:aerobic carbon-monoxide dehydrogenase medium subunit